VFKLIRNIAFIFVLALSFTSCSKEDFSACDDSGQHSQRSLSKETELSNGATAGVDSVMMAMPDSKIPHSSVSAGNSGDSSDDDDAGKPGISDDDDDENDDDRSQPAKPKKK